MWPNPLFPGDLVTFNEENLNGKLHFLGSVIYVQFDCCVQYFTPNSLATLLATNNESINWVIETFHYVSNKAISGVQNTIWIQETKYLKYNILKNGKLKHTSELILTACQHHF